MHQKCLSLAQLHLYAVYEDSNSHEDKKSIYFNNQKTPYVCKNVQSSTKEICYKLENMPSILLFTHFNNGCMLLVWQIWNIQTLLARFLAAGHHNMFCDFCSGVHVIESALKKVSGVWICVTQIHVWTTVFINGHYWLFPFV